MSRFVVDIPTPYTEEQIGGILAGFQQAEDFRPVRYKGDTVLKCGYGLLTAPQFIKFVVYPGSVHIEAWIRAFGERGLNGFMGAIPKQMLKSKVDRLIASIQPPVQQGQPQMPPQPPVQEQTPVQVEEKAPDQPQ